MDNIETRMEEIRATAESIDSGGISEGVDPQASIYRKDVIWLLDQLTAIRDRNAELENAIASRLDRRIASNAAWKIYAERRQAEVIAEYKKEHATEISLAEQLAASRQECERLRAALMDARRDEGYP